MHLQQTLGTVPDDELIRRLGELVSHSRRVEADVVAHVGEVDERRLWAREAAPSMFCYCTERLHLSEAEAYLRITVARAAREHPLLLETLRDGRLHLSGIVRLLPVLTRENRDTLLARAAHRSKRRIQELVAELMPRPDAPSEVRKLPVRSQSASRIMPIASRTVPLSPAVAEAGAALGILSPSLGRLCPDRVAAPADASPPAPTRRAIVEPLSPGRYKVLFTASAELHDKLQRLSALMRAEAPGLDFAGVIEKAVSEKLERLEARRYARTSAPRKQLSATSTTPSSRRVPSAVRRAVLERDGSRCGYTDHQGRRCTERDRLEFHHRRPFGTGGDHSPDNIGLLCRAHNQLLAEADYGTSASELHRRRSLGRPAPLARNFPP